MHSVEMRKQPSKRAQKHFSKIQWHSMEKARTCMNQHYIDSILTVHYWWTSRKMNNYRGQCASITIRTMVWVDVFHIAGARTPRTFGIGRMVWGLLFFGPGVSFRHSKQTEKLGNTHLEFAVSARKLNLWRCFMTVKSLWQQQHTY